MGAINTPPLTVRRLGITGANGFVGQHLVAECLLRGIEVVSLTRHGYVHAGAVNIVAGNYSDSAVLTQALKGCDAVIHLAGRAHAADKLGSRTEVAQRFHNANVAPLAAVVQAAKAAKIKRIVFVSSIGVNGDSTSGKPFDETNCPAPAEPYACSKLEAEQVLSSLLADGDTDFTILRPPLVYGPGCPGNLQKLLKLTRRMPVVPLGGINQPRTMVAVQNLCSALLVAAIHPATSRKIYVISDDRDTTVAEIVRSFAAGLGRSPHCIWKLPPQLLAIVAALSGRRALWQKLSSALQVDASRFNKATGWKPVVNPREGLVAAARMMAVT